MPLEEELIFGGEGNDGLLRGLALGNRAGVSVLGERTEQSAIAGGDGLDQRRRCFSSERHLCMIEDFRVASKHSFQISIESSKERKSGLILLNAGRHLAKQFAEMCEGRGMSGSVFQQVG